VALLCAARGWGPPVSDCVLAALAMCSDTFSSLSYVSACGELLDTHYGCPKNYSFAWTAEPRASAVPSRVKKAANRSVLETAKPGNHRVADFVGSVRGEKTGRLCYLVGPVSPITAEFRPVATDF
jgi:hypothetical protein